MKIFFDLDGTLLNSKKRLYTLFCDLTECNITQDSYWQYKKNAVSNEMILKEFYNFSNDSIDKFTHKWMNQIESDKYLKFDTLFSFTKKVLKSLEKKNHALYVITHRQKRKNTINQLDHLSISRYFSDIFVTEQRKSKSELVKHLSISTDKDIIVGDTGTDILAGKELGIKTIAVLSGFRTKNLLEKYNPDLIIKNISQLENVVL